MFTDCEKFLLSLHFAYGMALMKKAGYKVRGSTFAGLSRTITV